MRYTYTCLMAFALFATGFAAAENAPQGQSSDQNNNQNNSESRLDAAEKEFLNGDVRETQRIIFQQMDLNEDGRLNKEEAGQNNALLLAFDRLDENADGALTFAEFSNWQAFNKLDSKQ